MPYITSSIIMQILGVVVPKIEQWQQQGAVGQRKITQWTRYLTIAHRDGAGHRASCSSSHGGGNALAVGQTPDRRPRARLASVRRVLIVVRRSPPARPLLMWMGELVTQRGIGNGMSMLIFASVVSRCPAASTPSVQAETEVRLARASSC